MPQVLAAAGRRCRILPVMVLIALLAGCGVNRPNPSWQIPAAPTLESKDTVYYATDRAPATLTAKCRPGETLTTEPMYGNADASPGGLLYGEFTVQLPPLTEYGELAAYHPRPECLKAASDPVFLTGPHQQDRAAFFKSLRDAAAKSGNKQILVFVHGYDFEFDEAVLWTAELKRFLELDGPVVVYDWASRGEVLAYKQDEDAIQRSVPRLAGFLRDLHAELGDVPIDILAHSLGNRLLLDAVQRLASPAGPTLFRNVILAAPDVPSPIFIQQVTVAAQLAKRTTVYVSSADRALLASQRLHSQGKQKDYRAGRDLILVPGVDTVDVSRVDTSATRHSYYIDNRSVLNDVYQLLREETPPQNRFGLVELSTGKGSFWQLRP